MASFPPVAQIVGQHGPIYEAYYKQADPNNTGSVGALDAANFMKKSGVKDNILSQVWDMSDPTGKGYLEKTGFFVGLKLIALAQNGQDMAVSKLTMDAPQPNLGPVELAPEGDSVAGGGQWALTATEKAKYDQVFDSLHPVNNLLAGDKVRPVLLNSKLPMDILGRIWELSDIDKDGFLDRDEFALAMHLVHKGIQKETIPTSLPRSLIPPSKRKGPIGGVPVLPGHVGPGSGRNTPTTRADSPALRGRDIWVVTAAERANYDAMFHKADLDHDGFVSGQEIRDIFLQSGLQNNVLAHIWNLCDMKGIGKLTSEQFALAIHLVQQKLKGVDPPAQLTPELIPPSMRPQATADTAAFGVADGGTSAGPYRHVADFSAIKELDLIQKEIDEIKKEKLKLEAEQQQQTADIRICQGEVQVLEKELNAITSTLHQLENQKIEAQKCLDDLDDKKSKMETSVREVKLKCEEEQRQIADLNAQVQNQAKSAMEQDEELNRLRIDLGKLREEENSLEQKVESGKQQLEQLSKSHKEQLLQVNQTKSRVQHLQDQYRAVQQGVTELSIPADSGSSNTPNSFDDQFSSRATQGSPVSTISDYSVGSALDEDPFKSKDPFGGGGGGSAQADPFASDDPFKNSDPFKSEGFTADPFASDDPFKDAFSSSNTSTKDDPFSSADPFASSFSSSSSSSKKTDAFDPFGTGSTTTNKNQKPSGDLFGSDPFAPSPPTKGHSESPRPALPPKQKKAPPPRPAPPKGKSPMSSPSKPSKPDPFGGFPNDPFGGSDPFSGASSSGGAASGDAFANFADFSPGKRTVWTLIKRLRKARPGASSVSPRSSLPYTSSSSVFSDDELAWAFSSSTSQKASSQKSPASKSPASNKSPASAWSPANNLHASPAFGKSSPAFGSSSPAFGGLDFTDSVAKKEQEEENQKFAFSLKTRAEQEEADFEYALKLSRGEIDDSEA